MDDIDQARELKRLRDNARALGNVRALCDPATPSGQRAIQNVVALIEDEEVIKRTGIDWRKKSSR